MIKMGENQLVEFKEKINEPDRILNELSAFANSKGGVLLLGVKDNGTLIGLKDPEAEMEYLVSQIELKTVPVVPYEIGFCDTDDGKGIVWILIAADGDGPFSVQSSEKDKGKFFKRVADESRQMGIVEVESLKIKDPKKEKDFRYGKKEKLIFDSLKSSKKSLNQIQKSTRIQRHLLIAKMALLLTRGLLKLENIKGKEWFELSDPRLLETPRSGT